MSAYEDAVAAIETQRPKEHGAVWMVGEQLKDMLRAEPHLADLLMNDLSGGGMTLVDAEKKIAEQARKNRVGNCGCVTPAEAEDILRKFYGLPPRGQAMEQTEKAAKGVVIDLADFL